MQPMAVGYTEEPLYSGHHRGTKLYRGGVPILGFITTLNCDAVGTKVSGRNRQGGLSSEVAFRRGFTVDIAMIQ